MLIVQKALCIAVLLGMSLNRCWADSGPIRVATEFQVVESSIPLDGPISVNTVFGPHDANGIQFCPWEHTIENLDGILDAYRGREIAAFFGNQADPTPTPMKLTPYVMAAGMNPVPDAVAPQWFVDLVGRKPNPIDPPLPPIDPEGPFPIDPIGPRCLSCPEPGAWFESFQRIDDLQHWNLGVGEYGILRTGLALEPGALESLAQQPYARREQGFAGDDILQGGFLELLVYDSKKQSYQSVMAAKTDMYSLQVAGDGDHDVDLDVDGGDFLYLQKGAGNALGADRFAQWSKAYGSGRSVRVSLAKVPEPASVVLLFAAAAATLFVRRKKV